MPPAGVEMVFHPCKATKARRHLRRLNLELVATMAERIEDERRAWARDKLGAIADGLEVALGDRALLPVDEEES
jgi:hypothetical protein